MPRVFTYNVQKKCMANNAMHLSRPQVLFVDLPVSLRPGDGKRSKDPR